MLNLEITKIKRIVPVTKKTNSYCLTTAKNHNFFANGILVHNCQNILHVLNSTETFEVTIKLEGSSLTVYRNINDEKFPTGIC